MIYEYQIVVTKIGDYDTRLGILGAQGYKIISVINIDHKSIHYVFERASNPDAPESRLNINYK